MSSFSHLPSSPWPSQKGSNSSWITNSVLSQFTLRKLGIYLKSARLSSSSLPEMNLQITSWSLQTCISLKTRNVLFSQAWSCPILRSHSQSCSCLCGGFAPPLYLSKFFNSCLHPKILLLTSDGSLHTSYLYRGEEWIWSSRYHRAWHQLQGALDAKSAAWQGGGCHPTQL